ncbi:MAG TPA: radical SAM protein [bacterium]|nr:radical SAM protein [bacterium]
MKILHIRPPKIMGALERSMVQHPVNLLYLAAAARAAGHEVRVWDFEVEPFSEDEVKRRAREFGPDLAGATGLTANIKMVARIMGWIKEAVPGVFTAVGGPHGTAIPVRTLAEFPSLNAVVVGEGEETWVELAGRLERELTPRGIFGLAWRDGPEIRIEYRRPLIRDLDSIPFPARDLLDLSRYKGASSPGLDATLHRSTEIFTTRGCPERCIFCAAKVTFTRVVRFRGAQNVLSEVDECMEKWDYRHFTIEDDTFTYRPARLEEICKGLKERGVTWDCDTRVNVVTKEMLRMMADAGCQKVAFGVESGSPPILEKLEKGITVDQVKKAFKWAHEAGLITTAFFIIGGHPGETRDDLEMSVSLMKEIDPDLMAVAIAVPFPGTELEVIMRNKNLILSEQWEKYTHIHSVPCWRTEHFSSDDLVKLQNQVFRRFFLRPHFIWKTLKKTFSWHGIRYYTRSLIQILEYSFLEKRN